MTCTELQPLGVRWQAPPLPKWTKQHRNELKQLAARQGVVVLSNQPVDDTTFADWLASLGSIERTPGENYGADEPRLNIVTNVGREKPPRSVFHTDTSYVPSPPAYTALRVVTPPKSGGETEFVSTLESLDDQTPEAMRHYCNARVLHRVSGLDVPYGSPTETWQPLLCLHPVSKQPHWYLSTPERCIAAEGVELEQVHGLYHTLTSANAYRHAWAADDIVLWDNRSVLHRADLSQVKGERTLRRGMVSGVPLKSYQGLDSNFGAERTHGQHSAAA